MIRKGKPQFWTDPFRASREADQQQPDKVKRPMASGRLDPRVALTFGGVLLVVSLGAGFYQNVLFGLLLVAYFRMNVAYSLKLKHFVILDIMIIACGFAMRAVGGGLVIRTGFTSWFLMFVFFLSLFLAIGKRRHELLLRRNGGCI
ncbi:UbiA family prenyltransferase [Cohnella mopanensis]|uniref:UbiA family prenyltransferase n=1 Tax=Cohnella mopanensis TaxID=2911966 RepID=UPI002104F6A4|nr:UbiA family prenyltransferase [Cohnella mopanensis]